MIDFQNYKYLFLDRDGVLNIERKSDYVKKVSEFVFEKGALDAMEMLYPFFDRIFIITNQRGVGRGKMSLKNLQAVHDFMLAEISKRNVQISKIYYCTDINSTSINRKPNTGMAFRAQADFPEVSFEKSVFIGNSRSDIYFGKKLKMFTVLVGDKYLAGDKIYTDADCYSDNLLKFAMLYKNTDL